MSLIATGAMVAPVKRRAEVGPDLSHAITRMMATDPQERPQTATAIAVELRGLAATSGFGDATEELAAYFDDAAKFLDDKRPRVVSALVSAGKKAIAESRLPRAMALADRASALAPEDPAVKTLVETVTAGDRGARRRKLVALAALGVLVVGGAALGVAKLAGSPTPPDASLVAIADSSVVDSAAPDHVELDAPPEPDATQMLEDARVPIARDAALAKRDAAVTVAPPDVAIAPPDAPAVTVPPDAPVAPQTGTVVVRNDTWCNISVDGSGRGQLALGAKLTLELTAGPHSITCEQSKSLTWTETVVVESGKTRDLAKVMLKPVVITIAVTTGDRIEIAGKIYPRGGTLELKAGRYSGTVMSGGKPGLSGFFSVPRVACNLHEVGSGLACDP